jgi:four helix bundle protein
MESNNTKVNKDAKSMSYEFALDVIAFGKTLERSDVSRIIMNQLIRSATSIGANLIEARASSTRLEYKKYFEISLKSGNETVYWLSLIRDANLTNNKLHIDKLINEAEAICRMIGKSVITLKSKLK